MNLACVSEYPQPSSACKTKREKFFPQKLQPTDAGTLLQEIQSVCQFLAWWPVYALSHQLCQFVCVLKQKTQ